MSAIEEIGAAATAVAARVGPAVVRIGRQGGRGCGVVVGAGQVLTNAHNLRGESVTVTFADGRAVTGSVSGVDIDGDLAVVQVDTADTEAVTWSDAQASTGDVVFAVARGPAGGARVSFGIVSATEAAFAGPRGRHITGSIEHTAPLARGSSGSPVVDAEGALVGISTNRLGDGFYSALPAVGPTVGSAGGPPGGPTVGPAGGDLRARVDALAAGRSPSTLHLGVGLAPAPLARTLRAAVGLPERDGLLVRVVEDDSPAQRSGIRAGDLLVAAAGRELSSIEDLHQVLRAVGTDGGSAGLELGVVRGVEELTVVVSFGDPDTPGERPAGT